MKRNKEHKIKEVFRLEPELSRWLKKAAEVTGKTKTRLVEEALRLRMALKSHAL